MGMLVMFSILVETCSWRIAYLSAKIFNVDLASANLERLFSDGVKVLFLTNIGRKGDDFISFLLDNISASTPNAKAVAVTHQQILQNAARI
jgi:hypothetical protein